MNKNKRILFSILLVFVVAMTAYLATIIMALFVGVFSVLIYFAYNKYMSSENLLKQFQDGLNESNIVTKTDLEGKITFVNDKFCEISGYSKNELLGKSYNIIRSDDMPIEVFAKLWKTIQNREIYHGVLKNKNKYGDNFYINSTILPLTNNDGEVYEYISISTEISDIIHPSKQLIDNIKLSNFPFLMIIKFANYHTLLDLYPHEKLSKLENIFANEVLNLLPSGLEFKKVYELGNGEFAFLKEEQYREHLAADLGLLLQKFQQNINKHSFKLDGLKYEIKTLMSFATQKEQILESVKLGIKKAKNKSYKESIVFANNFAKQNYEEATKNMQVISKIEKALDEKKIISYFQPIINNETSKIDKYESLVRMIDEDGNVISPYYFIEVAKKASLYSKITMCVLENSFENLANTDKEITINLSALDIEDIEIRNLLLNYITKSEYYGRITFELLEDESVKDYDLVKDFISLAKIIGGVKIAIDDFGSGYSNYERLIGFQPDILKIDGSLVKDIATNKSNQNIVKSIVSFAKSENIKTVAEFVWNQETLDYVKSIGIDYSQGFFLGEPKVLKSEE